MERFYTVLGAWKFTFLQVDQEALWSHKVLAFGAFQNASYIQRILYIKGDAYQRLPDATTLLKIYSAHLKPSDMTLTVNIYFEREPLVRGSSCSESTIISLRTHASLPTYGSDSKSPVTRPSTLDPPGPLEISSSSRHGILAGIWLAQFLSVRPFFIVFLTFNMILIV